jgi:hypothetical protein
MRLDEVVAVEPGFDALIRAVIGAPASWMKTRRSPSISCTSENNGIRFRH